MIRTTIGVALVAPALLVAAPAIAQTPRDLLTYAAYQDNDVATALARIDRARAAALAAATRAPDDQDAAVVAAIAFAYRAKLTGNRSEAIAARRGLEAVVARFPRNPEAQLGLGAWHLGVIAKVGRIMARAGAGAQKGIGIAAVDRAVALGGGRAMFPGIAGMLLVQLDPDDAHGRSLVEAAVHGSTASALDRINQRAAINVLAALHRNDDPAARALADRLLPFGWFKGK
jgi:hypothetical protein